MMIKRALLIALIGTLVTPLAYSIDSQQSEISSIRTTNWALVVTLKEKKNGCNGDLIKIPTSIPNIDEVTAITTAAMLSKRKIVARYVECSDSPWRNTASAKDITIY
jgi:hypothetical protein